MKNIPLSSLNDDKERTAALLEAQLLSSMAHPNIVAYKESFQDSSGNYGDVYCYVIMILTGMLHIVMAYCEGGDLSSRLKACKGVPLAEDQVIEWFVQITLALQVCNLHICIVSITIITHMIITHSIYTIAIFFIVT